MNRLKILYRDPRRKQPWSVLIGAVALHILILIPILILYQIEWMAEHVYDVNDSKILEVARIIPAGWLYLMIAVAAPLWEEFVFRLWMGMRGWMLPIFTTGATVVAFFNYSQPLALGAGVLALILTYVNLPKLKHHMDIHFRWWFYGSVLIFGVSHLGNFELSLWALPLVMPQLLLGLVISFIRVQRGFWLGVLFHAGWNGLIGLAVVLPYIMDKSGEYHDDTQVITWSVGDAWTNSNSFTSSDSSVEFKNADVGTVLRWMIHRYEGYALVDAGDVMTSRVNLTIKGELDSDMSKAVEEFCSSFGLNIDTLTSTEQSYQLKIDESCNPAGVTREDKTVNQFLGLYYSNQNLNDLAAILQAEYGVKFSAMTNGSGNRYNFHLSTEGINQTMELLNKQHCIVVDTIESEVLRYNISSVGF